MTFFFSRLYGFKMNALKSHFLIRNEHTNRTMSQGRALGSCKHPKELFTLCERQITGFQYAFDLHILTPFGPERRLWNKQRTSARRA